MAFDNVIDGWMSWDLWLFHQCFSHTRPMEEWVNDN